MEAKIWNWDYQTYVSGLMYLELCALFLGLLWAKTSKQYEYRHLFAGGWLIVWGVVAIILLDGGLETIRALAVGKWIDSDGEVHARHSLEILRYTFPAILIAFGTRFVGNWIVAETPVTDRSDD